MGLIGSGGSYQQPFQPRKDSSPAQNAYPTANAQQTEGQLPQLAQGPLNATQAIQLLGQLLLAPLAGQSATLNPMQFSLLLKSLFQLPGEFHELLSDIATLQQQPIEETTKQLLALLQENPDLMLNLEDLQSVLKQAIQKNDQKLIQLMQSSQQAQSDNAKMIGELLGQSAKVGAQVNANPIQALNTAVLLYLPWYPLAHQQKLQMHFEFAKHGDGDENSEDVNASDDAQLVMLLDTNTLGRFKITTMRLDSTRLLFIVEHGEQVSPFLEALETQIDARLSQAGVQACEWQWKQRKTTEHLHHDSTKPLKKSAISHDSDIGQDSQERSNRQSIAVHHVGQVPMLVVQAVYWVARIIFDLDNHRLNEGAV